MLGGSAGLFGTLLPILLPAGARQVFRAAVDADDLAWARGRGWALSIALAELRAYRTANPRMAAIAEHVLGEISAEYD